MKPEGDLKIDKVHVAQHQLSFIQRNTTNSDER